MSDSTASFQEKLDNQYSFPALYLYKFIVTKDKVKDIEKLFTKHEIIQKPSKGGKYISTTIKVMAASSQEIIDTYQKASKIEGIISL